MIFEKLVKDFKEVKGNINSLSERIDDANRHLESIDNTTDGFVNVKNFKCDDGEYVKGDGEHDDTTGIQKALIYAYRNKVRLEFSGGTYLVSKPLMVISDSNEVNAGVEIKGVGVEVTRIYASENFSSLSNEENYNTKCLFMLLNETHLDENDNFKVGSGLCSSFNISNLLLNNVGGCDYGIYNPIKVFSSKFHMMRIRGFNKAGISNGEDFFLNILEKIRVEKSPISFDLCKKILTSNKLDSCYSVNATEVGFKVAGIYSTILNCCVDVCKGICFDLSNFTGDVIGAGAESQEAKTQFNTNTGTKVTIINPYTFGNFTDETATQLFIGGRAEVTIIGGNLGHDWLESGRVMAGYFKRISTKASLNMINVATGKAAKANDRIDYDSYGNINNKKANLMYRHAGVISYLGFDGGAGSAREKQGYYNAECDDSYEIGSAIFMGLGDNVSTMANGTSVRYYHPNCKGDILLTKNPENIRGIGWVNVQDGDSWNTGKYRKIPFLDSGSTEERPTVNLQIGQYYYDTTLGIPIYWDGSNWKKFSDNTNV